MDQRLIDYIKQNKEKRGSDEEIKKTLLDAGWKEGDIEEGFRTVTESKQPIVPEESVKKLKPKWLVPVIIVVGIIVLGLITWGGYELFKPAPSKLPGAGEIEQDQFKNWKTYRNEEYGFEVKYPKEWQSNDYSLSKVTSGERHYVQFVGDGQMSDFSVGIWDSTVKNSQIISNEFAGLNFKEENNVSIANKSATELIYYGPSQILGGMHTYRLYIVRVGEYAYALYGGLCMDEQTSKCNQILSTFKFIEKAQTLSPKEAYLKMKAEFDNIKIYDDLEAFTLKYGSKNQIAELEANREKINALPQSFKDQIVASMKSLSPSSKEITTIEETISGNTATLNVQSTKPGLKGTVTLVLEDNQWKLELESWKQ
jgi:hypothetical protein